MTTKYIHDENIHNLDSPNEIVLEILKLINPKNVVDFGCGIGTFLHCFKKNGVSEVLGLDGKWVNKKLIGQYLNPNEIKIVDLEKKIKLKKEYELVICLEVAEHINKDCSDIFIENLVKSGKIIIFSAAIPYQGGQNHINEQLQDYWRDKFLHYDYIIHDNLKPLIWNNPKVSWWYKQNIILVTHKSIKIDKNLNINKLNNPVHFELFKSKVDKINELNIRLEKINTGMLGLKFYFNLVAKALFNKYKSNRTKL